MDRETRRRLANAVRLQDNKASVDTISSATTSENARTSSDSNGKKRKRKDSQTETGKKMPAKATSPDKNKIGSKQWLEKFADDISSFPEAFVERKESGIELMQTFDFHTNWTEPIIINSIDGLDLKLSEKTIEGIANNFDLNFSVEAIDVHKQESKEILLRDFVQSWHEIERPVVYNILSLEFTGMKLAEKFQMPNFVRKMSWFQQFQADGNDENLKLDVPLVQNYCLLSMATSYTQYHIDFSGTSVFYHLIQGHKIFFIVQANEANLKAYRNSESNSKEREIIFAKCAKRFVLKEGETLLLPSGWIHAVYTDKDSIAYGGNFLHSLCVPMQLTIQTMEKLQKTPKKYRVDDLHLWNFYGAKKIIQEIEGDGKEKDVFFFAAQEILNCFESSSLRKKQPFVGMINRIKAMLNEKNDQERAFERCLIPKAWFNDKLKEGTGPFKPIKGKFYALGENENFYLTKKCEINGCETCNLKPSMVCIDVITKKLTLTHWSIDENLKWLELL